MPTQSRLITSAARWLEDALSQVDGDVVLTSPFLSYDVCRRVASSAKRMDHSWQLLTVLDPSAVANGYLSIKGMRELLRVGVEIFHVNGLHAKCFVVGSRAMLGSANLTGAGLGSSARPNHELGVELDQEQAHEALRSIRAWPSLAVGLGDLLRLEEDGRNLTVGSSQPQAAPAGAQSALSQAERLLADARDEDRTLWIKLEYGAPKCGGWKKSSFFASPRKGRPSFRPGDLVFICAKETRDCYAVVEVTSEAEWQPEDYAAAVSVERPGDLDRWPWVNRTVPRLVPDDLLELKQEELGVPGRPLQNGHIRLCFDQFTAGVRALARLMSEP